MKRRTMLKSLAVGLGASAASPAAADLPDLRITRIRYYHVEPGVRRVFNQSRHIVTVETDGGITGVGEGGHKDSIEQLAGLLIGENPARIEHLWQLMYRSYFYPPGREKLHALGVDLHLLGHLFGRHAQIAAIIDVADDVLAQCAVFVGEAREGKLLA